MEIFTSIIQALSTISGLVLEFLKAFGVAG